MGGRKSYPTKKYLGNSPGVKKEIKQLKDYIESKDVDKISAQSLSVFTIARKPIRYSASSTKFFPEIMKNLSKWKEVSDSDVLRREVSSSWSKIKQQNKISTPKEVDRIVVENAIKFVEGKRK